jgi:hypothetical protein
MEDAVMNTEPKLLSIVTVMTRLLDWIVKSKVWRVGRYPRILGGFPVEFILAIALAIAMGILPIKWGFKLRLLVALILVLGELACRIPLPRWGEPIAFILVAVETIVMGYGPVVDQYNTDAVLRDYKTTRDLVAKFQAHDEALKKIVAQYDHLTAAQSLFESIWGKIDENQRAEITRQSAEDLKSVLNIFNAIATPVGGGLRIKLGLDMYRVIYPVPMRIVPSLSFKGLPSGVTWTVIESSNLKFSVLFLPLSTQVEDFELNASADL